MFSPQQLEILLSLTDQDRHGYGIIQDVGERTSGAVRLGTGALYTAIRGLAASGLLGHDSDDSRHKNYVLTCLRADVRTCALAYGTPRGARDAAELVRFVMCVERQEGN